jgi:hypothetical protein
MQHVRCVCVHMETGEKKNKLCEKKRMILNVRSVCRVRTYEEYRHSLRFIRHRHTINSNISLLFLDSLVRHSYFHHRYFQF